MVLLNICAYGEDKKIALLQFSIIPPSYKDTSTNRGLFAAFTDKMRRKNYLQENKKKRLA